MKNHFKGKRYDYHIIIEAIGLYYHFSLSYRDCAKIMRKFSIGVDHTTIYRWNKQYGSTYTAATTIKGIEVVSALYKESRREITLFDFSPWDEIENLFKAA